VILLSAAHVHGIPKEEVSKIANTIDVFTFFCIFDAFLIAVAFTRQTGMPSDSSGGIIFLGVSLFFILKGGYNIDRTKGGKTLGEGLGSVTRAKI
jgi:hypothetical protein